MTLQHNFRGNHKARTKVIEKSLHTSPTKEFKETECCLCGKEMEYISVNRTIKIFGHNADPISKGHGRCCGTCNYTEVITARLKMMGISNK